MRRLTLLGISLTVAGCTVHSHSGPVHAHVYEGEEALTATFRVDNGIRYVAADGLPGHETGQFPNRGNPNSIRQQSYSFQMPANPQRAEAVTPLRQGPFGIALNGVLFDPGTAEFWRGDPNWNYDALSGKIDLGIDGSNAHVQPTGAYHYHGVPAALLQKLGGPDQMVLIGYAADGFPIYGPNCPSNPNELSSSFKSMRSSYRLKQGNRPSGPGGAYDGTFTVDWEYVPGSGDLDECNGRTGVTPEYPQGTYYYVLTEAYPFVPRAFRGTPDRSFRRGPGGPRPGGAPPPRRRPRR